MYANHQSNRLSTIAVFISPRKKPKQKPVYLFEFGVDHLNWQSFIKISKMACNTTSALVDILLIIVIRNQILGLNHAWRLQIALGKLSRRKIPRI